MCRLLIVALNVSDMFVVAGLQISTRLACIRLIARVAFQLVNARSIVWSGSCFGCCPLLQHYTTRGKNTTKSSAPEDGHKVARNMLSNL